MPRNIHHRSSGDGVVDLPPSSIGATAFFQLAEGRSDLAHQLADIAYVYLQALVQDIGATVAGHNASLKEFIRLLENAQQTGTAGDGDFAREVMRTGLDDLASTNLCDALWELDPKRSYNKPELWKLGELKQAARAALLPSGPWVNKGIDSAAYDLARVFKALTGKDPTASPDTLNEHGGGPTSAFGKFVVAFFAGVDRTIPKTRLYSATRRARECWDRRSGTNSAKNDEAETRSPAPIANEGGAHAHEKDQHHHQPDRLGFARHGPADRGAGDPGPLGPHPSS